MRSYSKVQADVVALAFWLELVLVLTCCYHASILLLHRHYGRRFRQRW